MTHPRWSRREALALASAGLAGCASDPASGPTSLNALAQAKGMRFGSAMGVGGRSDEFGDPRYRAIVREECGVLVAENEHKWPALHPRDGVFDFSAGDAMVTWATRNGIAFRGHNLVWNRAEWLPAWVTHYDFGARPAQAAERLLREHITTVCAHYSESIQSWDVINETVDPRTGAMRDTVFTQHLGYEANDLMFQIAREALPDAQLVYNDYMSWAGEDEAHRAGVLRLLERFRSNGTPVDALGLQSHIGASADASAFGAQDERAWRAFLDEVTGMGYALLITELDVHDRDLPAEIAARDALMADNLRAYLDLCFSYHQLKDVLVWGLTDQYSWLQERWPRADGLAKRPNLYDAAYQPKPMREAVAAAVRAASAR